MVCLSFRSRVLIASIVFIAALVFVAPTTWADGPPSGHGRGDHVARRMEIVGVRLLRPQPGSEVPRTYAIVQYANGREALVSHARYHVGEAPPALAVEFHVDMERGTYFTRRTLDREPVSDSFPRAVPHSGTAYGVEHRVETWEPARYFFPVEVLTRTIARLGWSVCGTEIDATPRYVTHANSCWANPNTFLPGSLTSWHTSGCLPIMNDHGSWLYTSTRGSYWNSDFPSIPKYTYATDTASVSAYGHRYDTWMIHEDSGGFASFISGHDMTLLFPVTDNCPTPPPGGGGGDDDDGDDGGSGGGGETCVPVYDGVSGDYLGQCCGETTLEIVECAEGYL
jgi:hypothetical protein